jgi:hypothetical protein
MLRRWTILLGAVMVAVVALVPALEFVCDAASADGHEYGHVHTSPAVSADGPAVPNVFALGIASPSGQADQPVTSRPAIFVPPRS